MFEEFFHIPIGAAFVLTDDAQEAFAGFVQLIGKVHGTFAALRCCTGMGIKFRYHRDFHTSGNHGAVGEVEAGTAVRGYGMEAIVFFQAVFEGFADQIFPVYHKDGLGFLVEVVNPVQQTFFVRVTADTGELMDFGVNFDGFTEQPHFFGTFYNVAPQCADSLIAYEQDGTFRTPEVMFQMMARTCRKRK